MSKQKSKSYFLTSIALMSAIAISFDVISDTLPLRVPWGMKIDFVGTVWVLSYFLYGLSVAFSVSSITTIYIATFMQTGYVGAAMKLVATAPMFMVPALASYLPFVSNRSSKFFNNLPLIIGLGVASNAARLLIATTVNYFWAIPLWTGIPSSEILDAMFGGSILGFIAFIAGMNVLQGIIDIFVAWTLAFKFKLSTMFGTW